MTIEFYVNQSEKNRLDKTLVSAFNLNGELKEDCSIIDPVIKIVGDVSSMASVNYMYIPSFGRYYFINNVISINNEICEVHAHVDVLSTYKDEIRAQRAIVSRQEKKWNLYLNDGVFKTYQNPYIITKAFSSGFTSQHFVLSIAGG
jgi:hypothetical protein